MAKSLIILGAGGHGRVCADIAMAAGFKVAGFLDRASKAGETINGIDVIGATISDLLAQPGGKDHNIFIALGDNDKRMVLIDEAQAAGFTVPSLIHPSAVLSPSAMVGEANAVMAGVVINANTSIGRGCILNTCCSIDHDNELKDGVQICPGVHAAGDIHFGEKAFIGTGACIIPGIRIGAGALVGAGSVVLHNVANEIRVAGLPARIIA